MTLRIRRFAVGDEAALLAVFRASVHGLAARDYTPVQIEAWAPTDADAGYHAQWARRMQALRPWVAEIDGRIVGYADLQPSGQIDHCFVAAEFARRGVGRALLAQLHCVARGAGIRTLWADVSLSAQSWFRQAGFAIEREQVVSVRGVALRNARMSKRLAAGDEAGVAGSGPAATSCD
ncbi:GNAT family N-acetyltransferase [Burkholderia plantarii]|uniref:GNAT family N-acetyltransferase n=1 Tax=Burkholderia plantarii TaxID=41899 RepID=UPI0006D8CBBE|nr:GNAT family N-acetyltransferase [Burkholderia plantarii]ALK30745.1 acetyltransferase, N-acetylglutamate synthase [Burkholderia plantarii]GLZ19363.1 acetyltransferase [Burkholderia plantarii]